MAGEHETTVVIRERGGRFLANAHLWESDDGLALVLGHVQGRGNLLTHYFGRGEREVVVEAPGVAVLGQLRTRWQGTQRIWLVRLEAAQAEQLQRALEAASGSPSNPGTPPAAAPGRAPAPPPR